MAKMFPVLHQAYTRMCQSVSVLKICELPHFLGHSIVCKNSHEIVRSIGTENYYSLCLFLKRRYVTRTWCGQWQADDYGEDADDMPWLGKGTPWQLDGNDVFFFSHLHHGAMLNIHKKVGLLEK